MEYMEIFKIVFRESLLFTKALNLQGFLDLKLYFYLLKFPQKRILKIYYVMGQTSSSFKGQKFSSSALFYQSINIFT